ncbi:MAG: leucine-rich repeat protein [Treponema sp.]
MIIYTNVKKVFLWATALCAIAVLPLLSGCPTGHKSSPPPPSSFTVTFDASAHGSLKAELNGKEFKSGSKAVEGSVITFIATPEKDYKVTKWSGASADASDKNKASLTVTKDETVSAMFGFNVELTELRLPGTGKAEPPHFNFQYLHGQTVELTVKGSGFDLSAFNIDDLKITVKDAGGADKGTLDAKTKKSATEITVQYTFPSGTDVPNLEALTVEAKLFDAVLKETFLPAAIDGTILKRWNKDSAVTEVKIPSYITAISAPGAPVGAFSQCVNITGVTVPDSVTTLGIASFLNCTNLTDIRLPSELTKIELDTFRSCSKLAHITIPENVTVIDREAFANCDSLTNITIPDKVTHINDWVFSPCAALASVTIGTGVTHIGKELFEDCHILANIVINSAKVSVIGDKAFSNIKSGARFTVKTDAIKTLIINSNSGINADQIEVKP